MDWEISPATILFDIASHQVPGDGIGLIVIEGRQGMAVNGENIPLSEFPRRVITGTLDGLLHSLRGIDEIDSYLISVHL